MYRFVIIYLLLLLFFAASCEVYTQDRFEEEYFVEAFMVAGEAFGGVGLSKTAAFDEEYSKSESQVGGAEGTIFKLDQDGNRIKAYVLYESSAGSYLPEEILIPRPRRSYELDMVTEDQHIIRAWTTIPDTFRVAKIVRDSVIYRSDEQVQVKLTRSWFPGRQNIFIFDTQALAPDSYHMTPYYYTDDESNRTARRRIRSRITTEGNFEQNHDGTMILNYPWLEISWFGPSQITIHAIDDNVYDYYRSQYVQSRDVSLGPGQIENVISNVEGGRGLLGGLASVSFTIYVDYPPDFHPPGE